MTIRKTRVCGCGHGEEHHALHGGKASGACHYGRGTAMGGCTCNGFHSRRRGERPLARHAPAPALRDPHAAALNALRDAELALRDATHAVARAFAALSSNGVPKPRLVLPTDDLDEPIPAPPTVTTIATGARRVLTAIASTRAGATREQLTILTGYKKSSRDTYLRQLFAAGHVEQRGDVLVVTASGAAWLGPLEPLPTGKALRDQWLGKLPTGERMILGALLRAYPEALTVEQIDTFTRYRKSSRDTYLRKLQARELVEKPRPGVVVASKTLFEEP